MSERSDLATTARRGRRWRRLAIATIGWSLACSTVGAATLSDNFSKFLNGNLAPLADSFAVAVGRSVPVIAASPADHYEFDPETGSYTNRQTVGGQLFVEHAEALGQGHLALSAYYLHVQFDQLDGQPLRELSDPYPRLNAFHVPTFLIRQAGIDVTADEVFFNATYGLRSWLDVNVAVPFVRTSLGRHDVIEVPDRFGNPLSRTISASSSERASGVGDVELRAKAQIGSLGSLLVSTALGLRLPTGTKEDFQGTGDTEITPTLIVSTPFWQPAPAFWLQGHLNLAMLLDAADVGGRSEGRWGIGLDVGAEPLQLAISLLGRDPTGPIFSSDQIDALTLPACIGTRAECLPFAPQGRRSPRTLFGLSSSRADYVDGSIGLRMVLWKDHLTGVLGMLAPMLDQGLTTEPIPVAGIEGTF